MKDKIIQQLREKKSQNGAEAFFLICADVEKLSPQFRKAFNSMLRHFEAIEQLKIEQERKEQSIKDTYASLVISGSFHEETAKLIAQKKRLDQQVEQPQHPLNLNNEREIHVSEPHSFNTPLPSSLNR